MRERARSKMATLDAGHTAQHGSSGRSPSNRSISDRLGLAAMQPFPAVRRIRRLSVHDRSNSDSNLAHPDLQRQQSSLMVSKNEIILGGEYGDSASVNVLWDIREDVGSQDWIGLYLIGERNPANYLSYKNRGVSGTHKGQIIWIIDAEPNFTKPLTKVCFKYYHGATGELRACTSTINIKNLDVWDPESDDELDEYDPYIKLTLSGVKAEGLKKGIIFNPHPYIKFSIQTRKSAKDQPPQRTNDHHHHNHHSNTHQHQQQRTTIAENTVMPAWQGQEFTFNVTRVDVLEIEVKDKFNRSHPVISRFLGKLSIPVQRLIEKVALGEHTVTYSLNKRHPSDHVSGYLTFTVNMEEVPDDHPIPNGDMGGHPEVIDMTRSASFPVSLSVSGNASVESSPRHSIISEELENAHNSVARSSSAPSNTVNHQREPKAIHIPPIEPPTPTDNNVTAPISNEQWSQATREMSERSLDQVESISCMYSLHGAGDSAGRELPTTVTTSRDTNGESIHRPLTIHIPGIPSSPALVSSIGTQVTPSPTSRPPISLVNESEERTAHEENQNGAADSVDINVTPPEENVVAPSSPLEASSRHSMSAPIAVSRRRSTDDGESVRSHPSLSPRSSLPNSLSRSPEGRHRALSDILLKQQIDEEVRRLRSRSSLSNSESSPQQSEQNSESGSSQSNVTSPSTPFSSSAIRANGASVERTSADSAATEPDAGSDSSPSSERKEQSLVDSPDGAACSRSHTRNNNNSLSQGASENAVPAPIAGSVNGDSSREDVQAVTNGPGSTEEQTPSVNGESSRSSPEGSSTASTPAASSSREDVVPPMGTQTSAPPAGSRTRRRSSHRNSAVWQKRQGLRAAAAGLHVTIPGATSESSSTESPTTPVLTPGHRNTYQRYVLPAEEDPLPENWEARIDQYGRVFYIDHQSRATTWTKPGRNQTGRHPRDTRASEQSRQQLDRRYQSIRRTLQSDENESRRNSSEGPSVSSSSESIPHIQNPRNHQSLMESPAVLFITRPDFFNFLHSNADAKNTFQKNSSVKHMVNRIRRDPGKFADYQHNRDLVALLNSFADPRADLPRGWETKKDKSGKDFFIDHNNRATSFIDPRLPLNIVDTSGAMLAPPRGRIRSRSEGEDELQNSTYAIQAAHNSRGSRGSGPPPVVPRPVETLRGGSSRSEEVPMAYNEKVVAFLRQPNIMDILVERQPALGANQKLKDKLVAIRKDGIEALEALSNDMELIMLLSLFEENIMSYMPNPQQANALRSTLAQAISPQNSPQHSPHSSPVVGRANARAPAPYKRDFDAKLRNFYRKLEAKGFGQGPTKLKLTIRRDHLLEDAFGKIMAINKKDIQKCKLFICFAGEEGLDYGGPSREFFFLLSRELFNPYYGLFEYSAIDTYTVQISPMSAFVDNYLEWFRFCGRVIGLAIIHHFLLDAFFTRPFYKALLRQLCNLTDLESLDSEFYRSLLWVKDNDITDQLDLTFTADEEVFGQLTERELKPNGKNIAVTEKNKKEYIEKMVRWRIERGVSEQTESLVRGFYEVVDSRLVSVFDARELELVIAGTAEIDVADWRRNTEYRGGYHDKHHVINWFWMAVERFDNERRLRLLQFVTGTSSIPYEGFAALRGSNGPRKFCIEKWGKNSFLPRAHTCFNRLDLPAYPTYAMLMEKLVIAVEETSTFGID